MSHDGMLIITIFTVMKIRGVTKGKKCDSCEKAISISDEN